jgi:hypothetical protein
VTSCSECGDKPLGSCATDLVNIISSTPRSFKWSSPSGYPICLLDFVTLTILGGSRSSSVSIVSDYGPDDREIEVRSPAGAKGFFSSLCVQTGSGAHPASCTMSTGVLSRGQSAVGVWR